MSLLVLGAGGQLGSAFVRTVDSTVPLTRGDLDLASVREEEVDRILDRVRPTHVVNCAAFTAVDRAEEEEDLATTINGSAVAVLARASATRGVPFVTYSTDYVFPGDGVRPYVESDPVAPVNAYGRSKLVGEQAALEAGEDVLVIRTSWVISGTHPNFVATMLRLGSEGRSLQVVDDQWGHPSIVDDLVAGTMALLEAEARGVVHLTNTGETTWYRLAGAALESAGIDGELRPCTTEEYPTPAARPAYSVLGSERLPALGVDPLPDWRDSLPDVVTRLRESPPGS